MMIFISYNLYFYSMIRTLFPYISLILFKENLFFLDSALFKSGSGVFDHSRASAEIEFSVIIDIIFGDEVGYTSKGRIFGLFLAQKYLVIKTRIYFLHPVEFINIEDIGTRADSEDIFERSHNSGIHHSTNLEVERSESGSCSDEEFRSIICFEHEVSEWNHSYNLLANLQ